MSAYLWINKMRKRMEQIEFVNMVRLAVRGDKHGVEKVMYQWAREAEINLTIED
jgi:hypothetical protein